MLKPINNPPNRFLEAHVEFDEPELAALEVFEETPKQALSENDSPDLGFRYSVNPYRGCFHACAYCYARPSHQYLGFGAGTDFDRKIVVKKGLPEKLREAFMKRSWQGEVVMFSGVTDCYQPLEASYQLTRGCLEVCAEFKNPVAIITKNQLVTRDIDLLVRLAEHRAASVTLSIPFLDDEVRKKIEPNASSIDKRFAALAELSRAGIECMISLAPMIPGLNDEDIPGLLERARDVGVKGAFMTMLRLPREVLPVFDQRLEENLPLRANKIRHAISELRGGKMNEAQFGERMRGKGTRWQLIEDLFVKTRKRMGLVSAYLPPSPSPFERPTPQLPLFFGFDSK